LEFYFRLAFAFASGVQYHLHGHLARSVQKPDQHLQKLNLAATAVSVALLSNAFLSPDRTTEKAGDELQQVMRIKEQVAAVSVNECVNEEIQATGTQFWRTAITFRIDSPNESVLRDDNFTVPVPAFFYKAGSAIFWANSSDQNIGGSLPNQSKAEIRTLEDFRGFWDELAATEQVFELGDLPTQLSLFDGHAKTDLARGTLSPRR
jgi:hypothetical protein